MVILGAGLVGGETADLLIEDGVEVSLVDMVAKPFADMGATLKWVMTGRLRKAKVRMFMESTISEISKARSTSSTTPLQTSPTARSSSAVTIR